MVFPLYDIYETLAIIFTVKAAEKRLFSQEVVKAKPSDLRLSEKKRESSMKIANLIFPLVMSKRSRERRSFTSFGYKFFSSFLLTENTS